MEYRSSNAGQHLSGALVAGVGSSHGIEIGGGSTGGYVQPVGDDANISLVVAGKGTGATRLGNSSSPVTIAAAVGLGSGASTTTISGLQRVRVDFTVPEIAANAAGTSTHTAVGLTTSAMLVFHHDMLAAVVPNTVIITPKCSTAGELRLLFQNIAASTIGTGLSTAHGYATWINF